MTLKIITVRVNLTKNPGGGAGNKFYFSVDSKTPLKGGLGQYEQIIWNDLTKTHQVESGAVEAAIRKYNSDADEYHESSDRDKNNQDFLAEITQHIEGLQNKLLERDYGLDFMITGDGINRNPSPFDVSLSSDNINAYSDPCYLFYICEIDNWYFRGNSSVNAKKDKLIIEAIPHDSNAPDAPEHYFPNLPRVADMKDRLKYFGVFVKKPGFPAHPKYPTNAANKKMHGFDFNIYMSVQQGNNHDTLIVIDPKIRNP